MNPANADFDNRGSTSPALFNRCVVDWFGDWNRIALKRVAAQFSKGIELLPEAFTARECHDDETRREAVSETLVGIHDLVEGVHVALQKAGKPSSYVTPRDYLDLLHHLTTLVSEKREEVVDQQKHLNAGLGKLHEAEETVFISLSLITIPFMLIGSRDMVITSALAYVKVLPPKI